MHKINKNRTSTLALTLLCKCNKDNIVAIMITLQITKQIVIVDILKVRYVFKLIYLDDRIISLRGGCLGPNKLAILYHNRRKKKTQYNIRTLSVNIKFICTSFRNRQNREFFRPVSQRVQMNFIFNDNARIVCLSCNVEKVPEKLSILPVSKARTNKFYIYRQCTYIVYVFVYISDSHGIYYV
jgi:hypothetical protein